jgi:hypothetical protein
MYLELTLQLAENGEAKLVVDTDRYPEANSISLTLSTAESETVVEGVDKHKLAQFVINCKRLIMMACEDKMTDEDDDESDDDDDDDII